MKKSTISIIIGVAIAVVFGITAVGMLFDELIAVIDDTPPSGRLHPDSISTGPLTLTKSTYKLRENIFFIVDNLREDEKGNIRFFVPDGRLYRTTAYDGEVKPSFSLYFRPDTSYLTKFCEGDEFVGEWLITFDKDAYPPLTFEILDEDMLGPGYKLKKAC